MATTKRDLTNPQVQGPRNADTSDDVISLKEVARRLQIPKATLYSWRYKGVGPRGHRVGKHVRYRWSDVLSWLDQQD